MKVELYLTAKNFLSVIVVGCVVGLAVVPLAVPADHLAWLSWRRAVLFLAAIAIVAVLSQSVIQSREDHQRDAREQERDKRYQRIDDFLTKHATALSVQVETTASRSEGFYVELYEPTFVYPKVGDLAFKLLEGKYMASGKKAEEVTTDCDLLVELYIVNKASTKAYIRDFAAWMEIGGEWRKLILDQNFEVDDLWSGSVEYGLEPKNEGRQWPQEPSQLPSLLGKRHVDIQPEEPVEGWLKFTVPDINPNRKYKLRVAVVDSVGKEHHIDKAVPKERQIGLRRVSGQRL